MYYIVMRQKSKTHVWSMCRGIYTNIAKTGIASLYFQCYNPISFSGLGGSDKYRFVRMWGHLQLQLYLKTNGLMCGRYIVFLNIALFFRTSFIGAT